jgi:hypothetical protein
MNMLYPDLSAERAAFDQMNAAKLQVVNKLVELRAAGVDANLQDQDGINSFSD